MSLKHYQTLNCSPNDELAAIKSKYRKLAKEFHPDVNPHGRQQFDEISQSWEWIQKNHHKSKNTMGSTNQSFEWDQTPNKQAHERCSKNLNDIFEMFKNMGPFSSTVTENTVNHHYRRTIEVSVQDCFRNFAAAIEFPEQSGQMINLNFPRGLSEHSKLSFHCEDTNGNLVDVSLSVRIKQDEIYSTNKNGDLVILYTVSVLDALENLPITITHPDGKNIIEITNSLELFKTFLSSGKFIEIKYTGLGFYQMPNQSQRSDAVVRIHFSID